MNVFWEGKRREMMSLPKPCAKRLKICGEIDDLRDLHSRCVLTLHSISTNGAAEVSKFARARCSKTTMDLFIVREDDTDCAITDASTPRRTEYERNETATCRTNDGTDAKAI